MSDDGVAVAIIIGILVIVAVIIVLIVEFLVGHPFISGFLIGLATGIGGTLIYYRVRNWLRTHQIVEVPPPD